MVGATQAVMNALRPENETRRLKALYHFEILDTEAEAIFDDLTDVASKLCCTPIAMISLIDQDRQWFKSKIGVQTMETPRDSSFCAHAINDESVFIVPDAKTDERFADNPFVTGDPNIRFYAGAPLLTLDGDALGTICVIDRVARHLQPFQIDGLAALSRAVMHLVEQRRRLAELTLLAVSLQPTDVVLL